VDGPLLSLSLYWTLAIIEGAEEAVELQLPRVFSEDDLAAPIFSSR